MPCGFNKLADPNRISDVGDGPLLLDRSGDAAVTLRAAETPPLARLRQALTAFIDYGRDHPARYRLLFSDPDIGTTGGSLQTAALGAFTAFAGLVEACQASGALPAASTRELAGLIYATAHGLIDLQAGGRMREHKGLSTADQGIALLLSLLETT